MSWYKGESMDGICFIVKDQMEGDWITCRPSHDIFLQSGSIIKVKSAEYEIIHECLQVTLEETHGVSPGGDVWFSLPELILPPSSSGAPDAVASPHQNPVADLAAAVYPSMPNNFSSPADYWKNQNQNGPSINDVMNNNRNDSETLMRVDTEGFNATNRANNNNNDDDDELELDSYVPASANGRLTRNPSKRKKKPMWEYSPSFEFPKPKINRSIVFGFISSVVIILMTIANIEVCIAIGDVSKKWLFVLLWTLLGMVLFLGVQGLIFEAGLRHLFDISSYGSANRYLERTAIIGMVLVFILTQAFGIPAAWGQAQVQAAENYLDKSQTKVISCWRNPNETITSGNSHFVFMEEPHWQVDWATKTEQKVHTLDGTNDDGKATGERFNFCVAPIVYTGNVPCQPNLYAVCFRKTENFGRIASCNWKDAQTCGWQYPSNSVTLRVLNNREQFWRVEDEDIDMWNSALRKVTPRDKDPSKPMQKPVLIGWGFEGPDQIQQYQDKAEDLVDGMRIGAYVTASVFCLLIMFYLYKEDAMDDW